MPAAIPGAFRAVGNQFDPPPPPSLNGNLSNYRNALPPIEQGGPPQYPPTQTHQRVIRHGRVTVVLPAGLDIPLDKDDYHKDILWFRSDFKAKNNVDGDVEEAPSEDEEAANTRCRFIRNVDGTVVNQLVVKAMKKRMKGIFTRWEQAATKDGLQPAASFTALSDAHADDLRNSMYREFPLLRLCAHDWKLDLLGIITYPSWKTDRKRRQDRKESKKRKGKSVQVRVTKRAKNATTIRTLDTPPHTITVDNDTNTSDTNIGDTNDDGVDFVDQLYAPTQPPTLAVSPLASQPLTGVSSVPTPLPTSNAVSANPAPLTNSPAASPSPSACNPDIPVPTPSSLPLSTSNDLDITPASASSAAPSTGLVSATIPTPITASSPRPTASTVSLCSPTSSAANDTSGNLRVPSQPSAKDKDTR